MHTIICSPLDESIYERQKSFTCITNVAVNSRRELKTFSCRYEDAGGNDASDGESHVGKLILGKESCQLNMRVMVSSSDSSLDIFKACHYYTAKEDCYVSVHC